MGTHHHHEQYLVELSKNVFRGQVGTVLDGYSVGDYCFGYTSVEVPGTEQARRGRNAKPRRQYAIDPVTSPWVQMIFHWFVAERRSISWIVRELNRLGAPKDHRSRTPDWRHQYVLDLLARRKYIGQWSWGEGMNVRDPLTGETSREERPVEECEKFVRHFPQLRLIDDETFEAARRRRDANRNKNAPKRKDKGRLHGSTSGQAAHHPRHLLTAHPLC